MKALGIHVFAGGFTMGVRRKCEVLAQLETHNFGRETAEQFVEFINKDRWEDWPVIPCDFIYGNPRCTGFSCITSGYSKETHGPWSSQTKDLHDLCYYGVKNDVPVICWESVQQAFSVGRPMLDRLRDELFVPNKYKIAHLFINAATFGNAQSRRRYFFVAYKDHLHFNVDAPKVVTPHATVGEVIWDMVDRVVEPAKLCMKNAQYAPDMYENLTPNEWTVVPHLQEGECLNRFARKDDGESLTKVNPYLGSKWLERSSGMPFSMHCIQRTIWNGACPTIHSSASRFLHPRLDRPMTIRELATIMGWEFMPKGWAPIPQIAKGVVPDIGEWLADQVIKCLNGEWGEADWESSYCDKTGEWVGREFDTPPVEKIFNLTRYAAEKPCKPMLI